MKLIYSWLALSFVLVTGGAKPNAFAANDSLPVEKISLPAGFEIKLYAQVPSARSMTLSRTARFLSVAAAAVKFMRFRPAMEARSKSHW